MARKQTLNLTKQAATTGLSQTTSAVIAASGSSQEWGEFAVADAAQIFLDISAVSGTTPKIVFTLLVKDPGTDVFVPANPASDAVFNATGFTAVTGGTPVVSTLDPCLGIAYQIQWTVTGTTPSFTLSLVGVLTGRGG